MPVSPASHYQCFLFQLCISTTHITNEFNVSTHHRLVRLIILLSCCFEIMLIAVHGIRDIGVCYVKIIVSDLKSTQLQRFRNCRNSQGSLQFSTQYRWMSHPTGVNTRVNTSIDKEMTAALGHGSLSSLAFMIFIGINSLKGSREALCSVV